MISQDGNVIYGTFQRGLSLQIEAETELLYQDDIACIFRVTVLAAGHPVLTRHLVLTADE